METYELLQDAFSIICHAGPAKLATDFNNPR